METNVFNKKIKVLLNDIDLLISPTAPYCRTWKGLTFHLPCPLCPSSLPSIRLPYPLCAFPTLYPPSLPHLPSIMNWSACNRYDSDFTYRYLLCSLALPHACTRLTFGTFSASFLTHLLHYCPFHLWQPVLWRFYFVLTHHSILVIKYWDMTHVCVESIVMEAPKTIVMEAPTLLLIPTAFLPTTNFQTRWYNFGAQRNKPKGVRYHFIRINIVRYGSGCNIN